MALRLFLLSLWCFFSGCNPNSSGEKTTGNSSRANPDIPKNTGNGKGNPDTPGNDDEPLIEECSNNLKLALANFLPEIKKIEATAIALKSDKDKHSLRELKNFMNDAPIGAAFLHCSDTDEIMKSALLECSIDKKSIDMKKAKKQCTLIGKINETYKKFMRESDNVLLGEKPSALSGQLKIDVEEYVNEIIDGFAQ